MVPFIGRSHSSSFCIRGSIERCVNYFSFAVTAAIEGGGAYVFICIQDGFHPLGGGGGGGGGGVPGNIPKFTGRRTSNLIECPHCYEFLKFLTFTGIHSITIFIHGMNLCSMFGTSHYRSGGGGGGG